MKTILCYGDSNTWGCIPLTGAQPPRRYVPAQRWPGVLRRELGDGASIVEEGLNGRTTVWDDPWSHSGPRATSGSASPSRTTSAGCSR